MPSPSEPVWKLTVAGIVVIIASTVGVASELWAKADKSELSQTEKVVTAHDKELALLKKDQEFIRETVKDINKKLDYLIEEQWRARRGQPPASTPAPSSGTLSNPIGR